MQKARNTDARTLPRAFLTFPILCTLLICSCLLFMPLHYSFHFHSQIFRLSLHTVPAHQLVMSESFLSPHSLCDSSPLVRAQPSLFGGPSCPHQCLQLTTWSSTAFSLRLLVIDKAYASYFSSASVLKQWVIAYCHIQSSE